MMRMVNGILTLTELQAGRLKVYPESFSLRSVVDGLHQQFAANAASKALDFKVELAQGLPDRLHGDSAKLVQCLECLLDNSIKFTHVGGLALQVSGKPAEAGRQALSFAVIDTGIGFTDLGEATMYQRFFQLDGSMTREYGGLGVGLAICRQLVELIGGRLTHRSEPGRGSRFQLDVEFEIVTVQPSVAPVRHGQDLASVRALRIAGCCWSTTTASINWWCAACCSSSAIGCAVSTAPRPRWSACAVNNLMRCCWTVPCLRWAGSRCANRSARCRATPMWQCWLRWPPPAWTSSPG